jgi:hypothetical protein
MGGKLSYLSKLFFERKIKKDAGNVPVAVDAWNKLCGDVSTSEPDGTVGSTVVAEGVDIPVTQEKVNKIATLLGCETTDIIQINSTYDNNPEDKDYITKATYPNMNCTLFISDRYKVVAEKFNKDILILYFSDVDNKDNFFDNSITESIEEEKTDMPRVNKEELQLINNSLTSMLIDLAKTELGLAQQYGGVIGELDYNKYKEEANMLRDMSATCMMNSGKLQALMQKFSDEAENIESGMQMTLEEE